MNESTWNGLPFNLDDVIQRRRIESNRVEYKATWNPVIAAAVVKTVATFANDLLNLNGGYILLGIEEEGGRPVLPPRGLDDLDPDLVQKQIYGVCKRINPPYQPQVFPVEYQGRTLILIWAPAGDTRPYQAPEDASAKISPAKWFARQGPMTVAAKGEILRQLMETTGRTPFDDRRNLEARLEDLSPALVRRFLHEIQSDLIDADPPVADYDLYDRLRLVTQVNGHKVPRNVALLFFNLRPDHFFQGARIEVVGFPDDAGGDTLLERVFRGPLPDQIREALEHLRSYGVEVVQKQDDRPEARRFHAYPAGAVEEALVNAVYHRGYDGPAEPIKVSVYPRRMEIISYPGPVASVTMEQLNGGSAGSVAPARNRRIGEFLKELKLAEARSRGIPKIQRKLRENGSPPATFDFDEDRTYYRTTLPIQTDFFDWKTFRPSTIDPLLLKELQTAMNRVSAVVAKIELIEQGNPSDPSTSDSES